MDERKTRAIGRMAKFAELYIRLGNATQAAIEAGYSAHSASAQGSRLLRTRKVQTLIEARFIDRKAHAQETYANFIELAQTAMEHVRELKKMCAPSDDLARGIEAASRHLERLARVEGLMLPPVEKNEKEVTLQRLIASIEKYTTAIPNASGTGDIQRIETVIEVMPSPAPQPPTNGTHQNGNGGNGAGSHA